MHIKDSEDKLLIDQDFYISKIDQIPNDLELDKFAETRMMLAQQANTRPNLASEISRLHKSHELCFDQDVTKYSKRLHKAIKYAHGNKASILTLRLDFDSLRIIAYSDTAFVNNSGLS